MRRVIWGVGASILAWLGGTHTIAAAFALVAFVATLKANRALRLLAFVLAPVALFAFSDVGGVRDLRVFLALGAAAIAWIPLFLELGGSVPRQLWLLPVVLLLFVPVLVGPWSTVVVASDIAARAQVLLLGVLALLVWSLQEYRRRSA